MRIRTGEPAWKWTSLAPRSIARRRMSSKRARSAAVGRRNRTRSDRLRARCGRRVGARRGGLRCARRGAGGVGGVAGFAVGAGPGTAATGRAVAGAAFPLLREHLLLSSDELRELAAVDEAARHEDLAELRVLTGAALGADRLGELVHADQLQMDGEPCLVTRAGTGVRRIIRLVRTATGKDIGITIRAFEVLLTLPRKEPVS